jgi:hypothetical protein
MKNTAHPMDRTSNWCIGGCWFTLARRKKKGGPKKKKKKKQEKRNKFVRVGKQKREARK